MGDTFILPTNNEDASRAPVDAPFARFAPPIRPQSELRSRITGPIGVRSLKSSPALIAEATLPAVTVEAAAEVAPNARRELARQASGRRRPGSRSGVLAFDPGGRRPDVPGGGVVAHSRPRDARCAHSRQDRARQLAVASRQQPRRFSSTPQRGACLSPAS